ncbi:DUF2867 domain-containing protein [Mesorhizobium ciceri]|uniref:DUF2867 domain-containing protein n=1 Tax=Mesorhizobium ciceri biovar biserrulae (strain HAMBI 2942 / LMG 23838 / WSM1271) TaxID=765698 RepID=E8TIW4_MESCW|nr:hypothetical protein Mesci_0996 [Mesorhizobium ciceri biovar biserrulae WSM1271]
MENAKNKDNPALPQPEWRRFATQRAKFASVKVESEGFAVTNPSAQLVPNHCDALARAQFADRYVLVTEGLSLTAFGAAERALGRTPPWVGRLMALRNLAVRPFRLKTGLETAVLPSGRIGIFPLISQFPGKVVLGLDDRHLDFRVLVEVRDLGSGRQEVAATTIVETHNWLGRAYLAIIMPFHRMVVPAMLAQILAK